MGITTNASKLADYKKVLLAQAGGGDFEKDKRFIAMEPGKKYRFRLINYENDDVTSNSNTKRSGPFHEIFTHSSRNEKNKLNISVCPTSYHGKTGFNMCQTCKDVSTLYKSPVPADQELGNIHRRKLHCYGLVFVVSDPTTPENNGHVKILHYGKKIKTFLDQKIFDIKPVASKYSKNKEEAQIPALTDDETDEELIGAYAFDLDNGYDLIISVSKDGDYNSYFAEFSRKASKCKIDLETAEAEIKELNFDGKDSLIRNSLDYKKYYDECLAPLIGTASVTKSTAVDSSNLENSTLDDLAEAANEVIVEKNETPPPPPPATKKVTTPPPPPPATKPAKKEPPTKAEPKHAQKPVQTQVTEIEDSEIDELMSDVNLDLDLE